MFRGSAPTKIDDKGRLKIPTPFRTFIEERWGSDVFTTSIVGDQALIYPLPEWEAIEARVAALPSTHQAAVKYLERVNYFGQQGKLDAQGRIVVQPILRESAEMTGEVVVSAHVNHLVVWNRERFEERLTEKPLTEEELLALSDLGI